MLLKLLKSLFAARPAHRDTAEALMARANQAMGTGDLRGAIDQFNSVLALDAGHEDALLNLGMCHAMLGDMNKAGQWFNRLLTLNPSSAATHMNLGNIALTGHRFTVAGKHYESALAASGQARDAPANAGLTNSLGLSLQRRGLPDEAIACFRDVLRGQPDHHDARTNLLFAMQHAPSVKPEELFAEFRNWAQLHEQPVRSRHPAQAAHSNPADPARRLRIGYVSGDFFQHAVANFIEPVLRHHDRSSYEVYCYSNREHADAQTEILRGLSEHWRNIARLDDDAAAQQIRSDSIDILIDLSSHTFGNRLMVFARKPAPVQITYLGYPATTGLTSIDYRITDAVADPPGVAERYHSEKLLRLPRSQWCYRPKPEAPPLSPLPALRTGRIMFGSFNNLAKLNSETLRLWARVLQALPQTGMTVACVTDHASRLRVADALIGYGAAPAQIRILGTLEDAEFWRVREEIDIVLDAFPYNGTTTTCEALWAGLPVVTLAGSHGAARNTTSLLHAVGLQELVADSAEQYIAIAAELAGDIGKLAAMRSGMRQRLLDCGLCDGPRFTGELEALYRSVWTVWCAEA